MAPTAFSAPSVSIRAPSGEDATRRQRPREALRRFQSARPRVRTRLAREALAKHLRVSIRAPSGEDATCPFTISVMPRCFNPRALG